MPNDIVNKNCCEKNKIEPHCVTTNSRLEISGLLALLLCSQLLLFPKITVADPAQAAVASAHPLATEAGITVLEEGGNAFDAAIAVAAALAVVEPAGSGLGGGGFWLLHEQSSNRQIMIDSRETAPGAAHRDMYLNEAGEVVREWSLDGPLSAAIPGTPAALHHLAENYGQLPLEVSLAPAIKHAREGFPVSARYQRFSNFRLAALQASTAAAKIFLHDNQIPELGSLIIQKDLANTLESIAREGRDGFYRGPIAQMMVDAVQQDGGIWTLDDLANYQLVERQPIQAQIGDFRITSAALPSAGGKLLVSMLKQLELLGYQQANPQQQHHYLAEVMRRAYRDRNLYLGDADFVDIPDYLTTQAYAQQKIADIDHYQASHSEQMWDGFANKGQDTTHFSIIDADGNRVAATLSINYPFGSGYVAAGTGVLLNDEMDDFSAQAGTPNAYELVSESANAIEPHKRPLSSMTPTFIENDSRVAVLGTPGGSRIITMVLHGVMAFMEGENAQGMVNRPRLHHQFLPDRIQLESPGFSASAAADLRQRGHTVQVLNRQFGNMQVVLRDNSTGITEAASDPRGEGSSAVLSQTISD
ncbi:MAG: gamma-glutamyltransferase [Methylophaga sp.]|nr:gamma-glutamyltransferase [Methylophaga sp.]